MPHPVRHLQCGCDELIATEVRQPVVCWRIGAWRVDPTLDEISGDGGTVKVEPRTMQLPVFLLAEALLFRGDTQAALRQIALESDEAAQWAGRAAINHALGRKDDSDAALKRLTELTAKPTSAYNIACVHTYRGESEAAFVWLERWFTQKTARLWRIKGEPYLNALKGDPRYEAFLRKMNLPQ